MQKKGLGNMFYKCKHFSIKELVDKETYEKFGESAWMFFNPLFLQALDGLREYLGVPLIVNNWATGGNYQYSGLRSKSCEVGAEYSQHRFGNAADIKSKILDPRTMFERIMIAKDDERLTNINAIEDINFTKTWVHIDGRNIPPSERIKIIKP